MAEMRNDSLVQEAAMNLFLGCAPERRTDLANFWQELDPEFQVHDDNHSDGPFIFDAGCYRYVRFNPRAMRLFWLGAYIGWEGFCATPTQHGVTPDLSRFRDMLDIFLTILDVSDPEAVPLPSGVPEPGAYPGADADPQGQAAAELATIAVGWSLLHEIRHLKHQQYGTSSDPDVDDPVVVRAEETSCDEFATRFLIEQAEVYSHRSGDDLSKVQQKRQLGVYMALFTIALITKDHWETTGSHPSLADRLAAAKTLFGNDRQPGADHVAALAFQALGQVWPGAPSF
jgi:hypothetical protein